MKKILLVSGCSWGDKDWYSFFHPDIDCSWPKWCDLIAEKYDMKLVNLCKSGAGNEYIYSSLFDYITTHDTNNIGLVLAAWSQCQRRDFTKKGNWTNHRIDNEGDIFYWVEKSLRYMLSFKILCEKYNLNYKQFQMIQLYKDILDGLRAGEVEIKKGIYDKDFRHKIVDQPKKALQEILKILMKYDDLLGENFIGWPIAEEIGGFALNNTLKDDDKISEIDRHPNAKGQVKLMEKLYDRLGPRILN